MTRSFSIAADLVTAAISLAAAPVQTGKVKPTQLAQAEQITPLPATFAATSSLNADNAPEIHRTCLQQCDVSYIRTHQICVSAVSGLKSQDAPQTNACDRAAKAGIQQCQARCEATSEPTEAEPALD